MQLKQIGTEHAIFRAVERARQCVTQQQRLSAMVLVWLDVHREEVVNENDENVQRLIAFYVDL